MPTSTCRWTILRMYSTPSLAGALHPTSPPNSDNYMFDTSLLILLRLLDGFGDDKVAAFFVRVQVADRFKSIGVVRNQFSLRRRTTRVVWTFSPMMIKS